MHSLPCLADVTASALTARLYELRKQERGLLVELLSYVGEVDRRRLYLEMGHSSLFAFLTDFLGYSHSSAFRRSTAARLLGRYPQIAAYLDDGRLGLTTLVELREAFTVAPVKEVLERAAGRTEEQIRALVAALRPRPEPMDLLRRLPAPRPQTTTPLQPASATLELPLPPPPPPPQPVRPRLEPIAPDRHVLRVTVSGAFVADLEAVRSALTHQIPDRDLEKVLHDCIRRTLREVQRRRVGGERPRARSAPARADGRYIPADVQRAVWQRDGARCAFVASDGHRCDSTFKLELHHIKPFALGGEATVANLTVRCAPHNRFHAEADFGREHMRQYAAQ